MEGDDDDDNGSRSVGSARASKRTDELLRGDERERVVGC